MRCKAVLTHQRKPLSPMKQCQERKRNAILAKALQGDNLMATNGVMEQLMSIENINLRKLLRIMYAPENVRISLLRSDIRDEIAKADGYSAAGGDFYGPFWSDAKDHSIGKLDLHSAVEERIAANPRRGNLYPQLRDGFLLWWNERRRWTNAPFSPIIAPKGRIEFLELNSVVKIENFLSVNDSNNEPHYVYPYFSPIPPLNDESARLALWAIQQMGLIPDISAIRVLDVIRGMTYSFERNPLSGNEHSIFQSKYRNIISQWNTLWDEYD